MKKKNSFRLQVSKPVSVNQCISRGKPLWIISYYDEYGRRRRISRASEQIAREEAARITEKLGRRQPVELTITESDWRVVERAKLILEPHGIELDYAMKTFVEALKIVDIHSLVPALRWYRMNQPGAPTLKNVNEVLQELLTAKSQRSQYTVSDLRRKLSPFAKAFRCPIASIDTADIEKYIHTLKVKNRTKQNVLRAIGTLFNYAKRKRYVAQTHPGISEVEPLRAEPPNVEIFTPDEMKTLLAAAPQELIPNLVIGAFCGLRTEEIKRLQWEQVNLKRKTIEVLGKNAKTRVARVVPLPPNAVAYLEPLEKKAGPVSVYKNPVNELLKLSARCGVRWKKNGLRHSFISYQVSKTKNVHAVSLEAGNSPKMIQTHYLVGVPPEDAEKWFEIEPVLAKNWKENLPVQQSNYLQDVKPNTGTKPADQRKKSLQGPKLGRTVSHSQQTNHHPICSSSASLDRNSRALTIAELLPVKQNSSIYSGDINSMLEHPGPHCRPQEGAAGREFSRIDKDRNIASNHLAQNGKLDEVKAESSGGVQ